jgi:hypothetical protein
MHTAAISSIHFVQLAKLAIVKTVNKNYKISFMINGGGLGKG